MTAVLGASQMAQSLVERNEDAVLLHRESEEVGIRDLLVPEEAALEWGGKGGPGDGNGPIAITRLGGKTREHLGDFFDGAGSGLRPHRDAQKSGFGKRTQTPVMPAP